MGVDVKSRNRTDARATSRGAPPQISSTPSTYPTLHILPRRRRRGRRTLFLMMQLARGASGASYAEKRSPTKSSPSSSCGRQKPGQASADNPPLSRATPAREETSIHRLYRVRTHREYHCSRSRAAVVDEEVTDTAHAPTIALEPLPPDCRRYHSRDHRHLWCVLLLHAEGPDTGRAAAA